MKRARRRRTLLFWPKAVVLTAALLALGWVVVTSSMARAVPPHQHQRLGIVDDGPQAQFRQGFQEFLANRGQLAPERLATLISLALDAPLAGEPFAFAGLKALAGNDLASAETLFQEARRRSPRLDVPRLALISLYLQTSRQAQGGREIAATTRAIPASANVLIDQLVRLAAAPAMRGPLVEAIGADPLMGEVLNRLARDDSNLDTLLALSARQPPAVNGRLAPWQSRLVDGLIERGELARARQVWRTFAGVQGEQDGLIYDPGFTGLPGGPPFNWLLASSDVGSAERSPSGGLEVDFFGRKSGQLAAQLLTLAPGAYQLSFRAEGSANGQGAQLVWRVSCRGGQTLTNLPLANITYSPRDVAQGFTIPASGCGAQTLELVGVAGEFPAQQAVRITNLMLRAGGGGR